MSTPPLLLAAGLALWGWRADLLLPAAAMALVAEGARLLPWRWALSGSDFRRLVDLSSLLFVGTFGWQAVRGNLPHGVFGVLQWSPLILFPLLAAQIYSTAQRVELSDLSLLLRAAPPRGPDASVPTVDLAWPYLGLCLLAASSAEGRAAWFYPVLCALAGWALWSTRPRRARALAWGALFALCAGAGYITQIGLFRAQSVVEEWVLAWLSQHYHARADALRAVTRIGDIGRLKLSERIALRVQSGTLPPLLLEAAYNAYNAGTWHVRAGSFQALEPAGEGSTWRLGPPAQGEDTLRVARYLPGGAGLLALPAGARQVDELPAGKLEANGMGAFRLDAAPGLVDYRVHYGGGPPAMDPPLPADLELPPPLKATLDRIAGELRLESLPPAAAVAAVEGFFAGSFRYSLRLGDPLQGGRTLADFLQRDRAGHCEYFATATVFLLRRAGVPARYAVGYASPEYSELDQAWLYRARHGHAWALAYVDGAWRAVDTTPALWAEIEAADATALQPLLDLLSWVGYRFSRWRWGLDGALGQPAWWLALPLAAFVAWRIYRGKRAQRATSAPAVRQKAVHEAAPAPMNRVIERLARTGVRPAPGETLGQWVRRASAALDSPAPAGELLERILDLYYRWRFDPLGLSSAEQQRLSDHIDAWLQTIATPSPAAS